MKEISEVIVQGSGLMPVSYAVAEFEGTLGKLDGFLQCA